MKNKVVYDFDMEQVKEKEIFGPQPHNSRKIIRSLKAKADAKRTLSQKLADFLNMTFGSIGFLTANFLWFVFWIAVNLGYVPWIPKFDPFPFGLLTMVVSLEAIILSIFVLVTQNRASQIDDLRQEIDLQVDIITEQEITKILQLLTLVLKKNGVELGEDAELEEMLKPINVAKIEKALEKQITNNH